MKKLLMIFFSLFIVCSKKMEYKDPVWKIGQTVEYKVKSMNWGTYKLSYSIFDKENDMYWIELKGNNGVRDIFVFQFLTPIHFRGKVSKQILKIEDNPPVLLESELAYDIPMNIPLKIILKNNIKDGKNVNVKTIAGMFNSIRYERNKDTLWVNPEIPITGIVKISGNENWELVNYSNTGAKSSITEKPVKPKLNF